MVEAIGVVAANCEINRNAKRGFLAAQFPGILTNHYFTQLDRDWYEAFVAFGGANAQWADGIRAAATGAQLEVAVAEVEAAVRATM